MARVAAWAIGVALLLAIVLAGGAPAEQASAPASPQAGGLDVDAHHSCALMPNAAVRCWGHEVSGQLGLAATNTIGDDETPAAASAVDLGPGRTARAVATGNYHSCAVLDDGSVRCWGFGTSGQLGYGRTDTIGDNETPGSAGPVDLGRGRTARAISAGGVHTCAVLDDGSVRCWGFGEDGRLGTGNTRTIGDDETPGSIPPVDLGPGRTARAVSAGAGHTCAVLDDGSVRCWGYGVNGRLGYGSRDSVGDDEVPGSMAPVDLGAGHTATAITAGEAHTCAILNDANVRCWGYAGHGQLGYGDEQSIGDNESPGDAGPVDLGPDAAAVAISAGDVHNCVVLAGGRVRCWATPDTACSATAARTTSATPRSRPPSPPWIWAAAPPRSAPPRCTTARASTTARCAAGGTAQTGGWATAATRPSATTRAPARPRRWSSTRPVPAAQRPGRRPATPLPRGAPDVSAPSDCDCAAGAAA